MRATKMTTLLVPTPDGTVYLVLDDFAEFGRAWRETDLTQADLQTVVANLLAGQYEHPLRVVAFNTTEGWARDATADVARKVLTRASELDHHLSPAVRAFVERAA